jgi:hypothetical protein
VRDLNGARIRWQMGFCPSTPSPSVGRRELRVNAM